MQDKIQKGLQELATVAEFCTDYLRRLRFLRGKVENNQFKSNVNGLLLRIEELTVKFFNAISIIGDKTKDELGDLFLSYCREHIEILKLIASVYGQYRSNALFHEFVRSISNLALSKKDNSYLSKVFKMDLLVTNVFKDLQPI